MKAERTYKELQKFDGISTKYMVANGYYVFAEDGKGSYTEKEPTKLVTNIKNVIKQITKHFEEFNELAEEQRIDNCSVDEKTKIILREPDRSYKFTKEGLKALNKAFKELENTKVEIHIRITEGEWELSDDEKEVFSGLVIPDVSQDKDERED